MCQPSYFTSTAYTLARPLLCTFQTLTLYYIWTGPTGTLYWPNSYNVHYIYWPSCPTFTWHCRCRGSALRFSVLHIKLTQANVLCCTAYAGPYQLLHDTADVGLLVLLLDCAAHASYILYCICTGQLLHHTAHVQVQLLLCSPYVPVQQWHASAQLLGYYTCTYPTLTLYCRCTGPTLHAWWVLRWVLSPSCLWIVNHTVDKGVAVVQVVVDCTCPLLALLTLLNGIAHCWLLIHCFSYSVTPEWTLLWQAWEDAIFPSIRVNVQRFREVISVSLKRFFWPPLECFPGQRAVLGGAHGAFALHVQPN